MSQYKARLIKSWSFLILVFFTYFFSESFFIYQPPFNHSCFYNIQRFDGRFGRFALDAINPVPGITVIETDYVCEDENIGVFGLLNKPEGEIAFAFFGLSFNSPVEHVYSRAP